MRDRLIELIDDFAFICPENCKKEIACTLCKEQKFADYLLENGVVVLNKENNSVEDMIELLKAQIAVLQGWGNINGK